MWRWPLLLLLLLPPWTPLRVTQHCRDLCIINFAIACSFHSIDFCVDLILYDKFNGRWKITRPHRTTPHTRHILTHTHPLFMFEIDWYAFTVYAYVYLSHFQQQRERAGMSELNWQNYKFYQFSTSSDLSQTHTNMASLSRARDFFIFLFSRFLYFPCSPLHQSPSKAYSTIIPIFCCSLFFAAELVVRIKCQHTPE